MYYQQPSKKTTTACSVAIRVTVVAGFPASNYWWESFLEVKRQNSAGRCQQTFENKKFVDMDIR